MLYAGLCLSDAKMSAFSSFDHSHAHGSMHFTTRKTKITVLRQKQERDSVIGREMRAIPAELCKPMHGASSRQA